MARMCRKANSSTLLGECKLLWPLWKTVWRFLKKLKTKLSWVHVCMLSCIYCAQLYDPMHCSPTGSSFHGILQARILEWVAMPSSRGFSWPRDRTHVSYISCTSRQVLYHWYHLGSLPYDPAIPLMGIYMKKKTKKQKKNRKTLSWKYTNTTFIAALFTIKKTTQIMEITQCPSPDEWIKKMWDIYIISHLLYPYMNSESLLSQQHA